MYDPNDLSRTIYEAVVTLKGKVLAKLPNLRIPDYVKDKCTFALNYYPHKFPHLLTSEMDLAFAPPFPWWFVCGKILEGTHKRNA